MAHASVLRTLPEGQDPLDFALRSVIGGQLRPEEVERGLHDPMQKSTSDSGVGPLIEYFQGHELLANGTLRLRFSESSMSFLNQAACAQSAVKSAIEKTAGEFPQVKRFEYIIDGFLVDDWDA